VPRDRALHGINSAGKIGDEAIARCIEDTTAMRGDQGSCSLEVANAGQVAEVSVFEPKPEKHR
jgi:hypothetical protein